MSTGTKTPYEKAIPVVVNVKHDKRPGIVYIGRQMPGYEASPLGNPYKAGEHPDPIGMYKRWLWNQLQIDTPQRREIEWLAAEYIAGKEILLGCWCAPNPCHGTVVKAAIEWMAKQQRPAIEDALDFTLDDVPELAEVPEKLIKLSIDVIETLTPAAGRRFTRADAVRIIAEFANEPLPTFPHGAAAAARAAIEESVKADKETGRQGEVTR